MSCNVVSLYVDFCRDNYYKYLKYFMGNSFKKDIVNKYLDVYINCRYYNLYENKSKSNIAYINYYLKEECYKLLDGVMDLEEIINIKDICSLFDYIMYIDGIKKYDDIDNFVKKIKDDLTNKYDNDLKDFEVKFKNMLNDDTKKLDAFISNLDSNEFWVTFKQYNIKNVYETSMNYDLRIPKIYSDYSINKVYTSNVISEDVLFMLYYMVSKRIIDDIIKMNFDNDYLVDFKFSLFEKKEKINRLFKIIDSDIVKDMICIKVNYDAFISYKDEIYDYKRDGYSFALVLDKDIILDEISFQKLGVFKYIVNYGNKDDKLKRLDNVININSR